MMHGQQNLKIQKKTLCLFLFWPVYFKDETLPLFSLQVVTFTSVNTFSGSGFRKEFFVMKQSGGYVRSVGISASNCT
jgi:hypothetical protein